MLGITACHSGPYPVSSPYYSIPTGSTVVLKQTLKIPANTARVYIQYGEPLKEVDQYEAHCWYYSWKVLDTPQFVHADTFTITSVQHSEEVVSLDVPIQLASLSIAHLQPAFASATAIEYKTIITIHSQKQPDIRQLICNHWEDPSDARHLTFAEISSVLGDITTIKLK